MWDNGPGNWHYELDGQKPIGGFIEADLELVAGPPSCKFKAGDTVRVHRSVNLCLPPNHALYKDKIAPVMSVQHDGLSDYRVYFSPDEWLSVCYLEHATPVAPYKESGCVCGAAKIGAAPKSPLHSTYCPQRSNS